MENDVPSETSNTDRDREPAIAGIWRIEPQLVAAIDASILHANELKRDRLAGVVQLEPSRIEPDATRAEVGKVGAADALHPSLVDAHRERRVLGVALMFAAGACQPGPGLGSDRIGEEARRWASGGNGAPASLTKAAIVTVAAGCRCASLIGRSPANTAYGWRAWDEVHGQKAVPLPHGPTHARIERGATHALIRRYSNACPQSGCSGMMP